MSDDRFAIENTARRAVNDASSPPMRVGHEVDRLRKGLVRWRGEFASGGFVVNDEKSDAKSSPGLAGTSHALFLSQTSGVRSLGPMEQMMSDVKWALLPDGLYPAEIVNTKFGPMKNGRGLSLTLECRLDGSGRKLWPAFNVRHDSPRVTEIAREQLAELGRALKIDEPIGPDTALTGCRVMLVVRTEQSDDLRWSDRNVVVGYRSIEPTPAPAPEPPPMAELVTPAAVEAVKTFRPAGAPVFARRPVGA